MGYEGANKMNNCLMMATSLSNDTTTSSKEKKRCTDKIHTKKGKETLPKAYYPLYTTRKIRIIYTYKVGIPHEIGRLELPLC